MTLGVSIILLVVVSFIYYKRTYKTSWKRPNSNFPESWRIILTAKIPFYNSLEETEKKQFEDRIHTFLLNHKITGIGIEVTLEDRILIASSAIIPVFAFPNWRYTNLEEVLVYSDTFNDQFETEGRDRNILGMVGSGYMNGKMILSKRALHHGFDNATDKRNTAIHEFVHLIDKMDGEIDGIPDVILKNQYALPWLDLINQKMDEIYAGKSDINPYGGTNRAEFLAVSSEYFFERPDFLAEKHPKLYQALEGVFNQKLKYRRLIKRQSSWSRNDKCPCGSKQKYKRCCFNTHQR
jgi:MtfA peptidase